MPQAASSLARQTEVGDPPHGLPDHLLLLSSTLTVSRRQMDQSDVPAPRDEATRLRRNSRDATVPHASASVYPASPDARGRTLIVDLHAAVAMSYCEDSEFALCRITR